MKRELTPEERAALLDLADDVERRARACDSLRLDWADRAGEANRLAREILEALRERHDASVRISAGDSRLTLMGVRATCTSGPLGLLHNWVAGARRKAMSGSGATA